METLTTMGAAHQLVAESAPRLDCRSPVSRVKIRNLRQYIDALSKHIQTFPFGVNMQQDLQVCNDSLTLGMLGIPFPRLF